MSAHSALPDTRKVYLQDSQLHMESQPTPILRPGCVLVQVHCVSLMANEFSKASRSYIPAGAFSGTILQVPLDSAFSVGDKVFGRSSEGGALSEIIMTNTDVIYKKPTNIDFASASLLGGAGLMALNALDNNLPTHGKPRVLIHGGHTAIGTFAIQIAKILKAHVEVTTIPSYATQCRDLGADEIIDPSEKYGELLAAVRVRHERNFHLVIDCLDDDDSIFDYLSNYTTPGAKYISAKEQSSAGFSFKLWKRMSLPAAFGGGTRPTILLKPAASPRQLALLVQLLKDPRFVGIEVDEVYNWLDIEHAITSIDRAQGFGGVVVRVTEDDNPTFVNMLEQLKASGPIDFSTISGSGSGRKSADLRSNERKSFSTDRKSEDSRRRVGSISK